MFRAARDTSLQRGENVSAERRPAAQLEPLAGLRVRDLAGPLPALALGVFVGDDGRAQLGLEPLRFRRLLAQLAILVVGPTLHGEQRVDALAQFGPLDLQFLESGHGVHDSTAAPGSVFLGDQCLFFGVTVDTGMDAPAVPRRRGCGNTCARHRRSRRRETDPPRNRGSARSC